jgi:hypothetical protein
VDASYIVQLHASLYLSMCWPAVLSVRGLPVDVSAVLESNALAIALPRVRINVQVTVVGRIIFAQLDSGEELC